MEKNEIILYGILFVVVVGLAFSVVSMVKSKQGLENNPANYNKFVSAQNPNDICKTPEGYTDKDWKEHMGHHPDQYKECL